MDLTSNNRVHLIPDDDDQQRLFHQPSLCGGGQEGNDLVSRCVSVVPATTTTSSNNNEERDDVLQNFCQAANQVRSTGAALISNQALQLNRELLVLVPPRRDSPKQRRSISPVNTVQPETLFKRAQKTKRMAILMRQLECVQEQLFLELAAAGQAPVQEATRM